MEKIRTYKIENKKYTVITKNIEKTETIDKLYEVICQYIISQRNENNIGR